MTTEQFAAFMAAVDSCLGSLDGPYTLLDGVVGFPQGGGRLSLGSLALECSHLDLSDYLPYITCFLTELFNSERFMAELDTTSLETVRQYLAVRLYNQDYAASTGSDATYQPFAGGVVKKLVYDFPHAVVTIPEEDIVAWGLPLSDLFEIGIDNVRRNNTLAPEPIDIDGQQGFALSVDHFFAGNLVFEMAENLDLSGPGGALVSLPNRSNALVFPIVDLGVLQMVPVLHQVSLDGFANYPGALTPSLFWYHDGQFDVVDCQETDQGLSIMPSNEFVHMLNTLAAVQP